MLGVGGGRRLLTTGPVGVEDAGNAHVDAILVVEAVSQGLGDALALVIARAWADGVDVAPTALGVNRMLTQCGDTAATY